MDAEKERPAYVRFEKRAVEDRAQTMAQGRYVAKDALFVLITPPGSKDEVPRLVSDWLVQLDEQVKQDRISPRLVDLYKQSYERWMKGEEVPLHGTSLKLWPIVSPAEIQNCLAANIRTVEDLAQANGEAVGRLGMSGYSLKQKAEAWLKAAGDTGKVTLESVALRTENATLKTQILALEKRNEALVAQLAAAKPAAVPA